MTMMPPSHANVPYSTERLRQLYPANVKLEQVQILMRHGERTPTSARFENAGLAAFWPYCSAAKQLLSLTFNPSSSTWNSAQWRRHLERFDANDNAMLVTGPQGEVDGMCNLGDLTDPGRRSSQALGAHLRRLYVDQLHFLPSTISDPDILYLRATRIPRAIESLQEAFWGIYPPHWRARTFPPPAMILRAPAEETLTPSNSYCKRFAQLAQAFSRRSAERWNESPEMDYLNNLIGKWMPEQGQRVAIDSQPRLSGILDTIHATLAHGDGTRLPNEFYDKRGMAIINRLVIEEWFSGYGESNEYRALGIGSLMGDILSRMVQSVELNDNSREESQGVEGSDSAKSGVHHPDTAIKLALTGCHDTTLAAVLTSLGAVKLEMWPPFTSHIALELFRESDDFLLSTTSKADKSPSEGISDQLRQPSRNKGTLSDTQSTTPASSTGRGRLHSLPPSTQAKLDRYYVRVLYSGQPVTVPGCRAEGKHLAGEESFCTLKAFKSVVDGFTPVDWKKQCQMNLGENAFPKGREPAGY